MALRGEVKHSLSLLIATAGSLGRLELVALSSKVKHCLGLLVSATGSLRSLELVSLRSEVEHGLSLLVATARGLGGLELVTLRSKVQHSLGLLIATSVGIRVALNVALAFVFDLRQVDVLVLLDGDAVGEGGKSDHSVSESHHVVVFWSEKYIIVTNFGGEVFKPGSNCT